jgi:hypothetical protein
VLRDAGVVTATARPDQRPLSDALVGEGDILGIPGWIVVTRAEATPRLAEGLNEATMLALEQGASRAACVFYRPQAGAGEAYAVMKLATLGEIVRSGESGV